MEALTQVLSAIPSGALPLVVVILGLFWIYRKTESINKDREDTKQQRDKDSQNIHDDILSLKFKVSNLEGRSQLHDEILGDLNKQMNALNVNIASLAVKIDNLSQSLKEVNK